MTHAIKSQAQLQASGILYKHGVLVRLHRTVFAPVRTVHPVRQFLKNEPFALFALFVQCELFALFAVRTVRTM